MRVRTRHTFMTGGDFFCPPVVRSLAPSFLPGATAAALGLSAVAPVSGFAFFKEEDMTTVGDETRKQARGIG